MNIIILGYYIVINWYDLVFGDWEIDVEFDQSDKSIIDMEIQLGREVGKQYVMTIGNTK